MIFNINSIAVAISFKFILKLAFLHTKPNELHILIIECCSVPDCKYLFGIVVQVVHYVVSSLYWYYWYEYEYEYEYEY